jgi:hypothetical protein
MPNKKRILKSERFISGFIEPGGNLYIGILWEDYSKSPDLNEYGLPTTFTEGQEALPLAKGGSTKANQNGKKVRKQPEERTTRTVHISYTRRKDGARISYNRDFNVYVTELANKYDMKFVFKTNEHGQQVVVSPVLQFTDEYATNLMNTHAINLFLEVFGEFEVFNSDLNPAIPFNKRYKEDFLKKGVLKKGDTTQIQEIIDAVDKFVRDPVESKAFAKRLFTFIEYRPDVRGKGPLGFYGYIVFGFKNRGIIVLESMYKGHATYVFDEHNYEDVISKTKYEVYRQHLYKERFVHTDDWETKVRAYMTSFGVTDGTDEGVDGGAAPVVVPAA